MPIRPALAALAPLLAALALAGCDGAAPEGERPLVVEAFFDTGQPLPDVWVRRAQRPDAYGTADGVPDAAVAVRLFDEVAVPYVPDPAVPGRYRPAAPLADTVVAGAEYVVRVTRGAQAVVGTAVPPARLHVLGVSTAPRPTPERGVDLDPATLGSFGTVPSGYFYAVDVAAEWAVGPDTLHALRLNLRPSASGGGRLFFPTDVVRTERDLGVRVGTRWTVRRRYLVAVDGAASPLPPHRVRVALVRGDAAYRRFADGLGAPDRRTPVSTVTGGLGVVAGVSVDSVTVDVAPGGSTVR